MIIIQNLTKKFGQKTVLLNINLEIEKGKVYGIVGENGAGKTTLFRCLANLEKFDGKIISGNEAIKNQLGYLPSELFFFEKLTGKEYIQLLMNARNIKIDHIEDKNIFHLPLNQYASTYSMGMKKKLALIAILLQKNEYFILDEPFNGVDIQSNIMIIEIILKLKALKKTIFISSHIFSTLYETCDQIYVLSKGEITKSVQKSEFLDLEAEMKKMFVGNQIEKLKLS
jgi:ABC-2 type transport system ATP-binding protein